MAKPKLTPQTPGEPVEGENTAPEAEQPTTTETTEAVADPVVELVPVVAPVAGGLPDESEIDPSAIERPVLSKQGWVMPKGR